MAEIGEIGDGVEHGAAVVEHDRIGVDALTDAVEQHDRHVGLLDDALKDAAVADARHDQPVDHPVEQEPDLLVLRVEVLIGAAQHHRVAGPVEGLLDDRDDVGEERVGDVRDGEADGARGAHLQAAGDGVALVADVADGLLDALGKLGADGGRAIDQRRHGGDRNARRLGDMKHGRRLGLTLLFSPCT